MTDWNTCAAIERNPGKVSGSWVFKRTRVPVSALFNNLKSGATVDEFVEWFPGVTRQQVEAVLSHQIQSLEKGLEDEDTSGPQRAKTSQG